MLGPCASRDVWSPWKEQRWEHRHPKNMAHTSGLWMFTACSTQTWLITRLIWTCCFHIKAGQHQECRVNPRAQYWNTPEVTSVNCRGQIMWVRCSLVLLSLSFACLPNVLIHRGSRFDLAPADLTALFPDLPHSLSTAALPASQTLPPLLEIRHNLSVAPTTTKLFMHIKWPWCCRIRCEASCVVCICTM